MKPLELHIYDKHPDADAYRVGGFYSPYCLVATEKRFSGAEMAAEYHAAMHELDMDWVQTGADDPKLMRIVGSLRRFARLPHYDEADQ